MKKAIILLFSLTNLLTAQYLGYGSISKWEQSGNDIYYNDGKIGIGIIPTMHFHLYRNSSFLATVESNTGNVLWNFKADTNIKTALIRFYDRNAPTTIVGGFILDRAVVTITGGAQNDISLYTRLGSAHSIHLATQSIARLTVQSDGSIVIGSPTGGGKGVGTINAVGVYDDNVLLTDYVFEDNYKQLSIIEMEKFYVENKHLPTIKGRKEWESKGKFSIGEISKMLWETVEVQAKYIVDLEKRISKLEAK